MSISPRACAQHHLPIASFAIAALATGLVLGGGLSASAATAFSGSQEPGRAASFAATINNERASNHRPRLAVSSALTAAAESWAASMARSNTLAHNPHLSSEVSGWQYLGENVGVGYSVGQLESAFWDSPGHRSNILDLDFTRVGVGVVDVGGKLWVAEEFERPYGASSAGASTVHPQAAHRTAQTKSTTHAASQARTAQASGRPAILATDLPWPDRVPLGQWVVPPALDMPVAAVDLMAFFPLNPPNFAGS